MAAEADCRICISAEAERDPSNKYPGYDPKPSHCEPPIQELRRM